MQALTEADVGKPPRLEGPDWWRSAIGYEIYIRSFLDTDGDGVGDLNGITAKLDYLADLGLDVVWVTPFFPSPGLDHGYDVADYCDVDPLFGTLDDWDRLVAGAHRRGLRLFVDIVPNHTSSAHPWFQQAMADPSGPYRDYYVWTDAKPDGGVPNNWVSHFGGPAWSLDPGGSGQYYCHLFLPEQPDLNWANPKVMEEFVEIMRFWVRRGADGFRIDVAHGLTKDPALRDNPQLRPVAADMHPEEVFCSFVHKHDLHRAETAELFRQWRTVADAEGAVLLGEMGTRDVHRFAAYCASGDALHVGFVLKVGQTDWDATTILDDLLAYQAVANGGTAWEASNHDQRRSVSRYGEGGRGLRRTLALLTLMTAFDGPLFLYQGEELGLPDAVLVGDAEDPVSTRNDGAAGRDVARGGVPWTTEAHNGFTTAEPWLRTAPLDPAHTVEVQLADPDSTLHRYRDLTVLRKRTAMHAEPFTVAHRDGGVLVVRRGRVEVVGNLAATPFRWPSPTAATIVFESQRGAATVDDGELVVAPESSVVRILG